MVINANDRGHGGQRGLFILCALYGLISFYRQPELNIDTTSDWIMLVWGNGIDGNVHQEVKPEYLIKLEEIRKLKGIRFKTAEEFDMFFQKG